MSMGEQQVDLPSRWWFFREFLRCLLWAMLWNLAAGGVIKHFYGDVWWGFLITVPVIWGSFFMARSRSLRWRWLLLKHRGELDKQMSYNEDGQLHTGMILPFEEVHVVWDVRINEPAAGHIHTRDFLGRERLRAVTTWSPDFLELLEGDDA